MPGHLEIPVWISVTGGSETAVVNGLDLMDRRFTAVTQLLRKLLEASPEEVQEIYPSQPIEAMDEIDPWAS